MLLEHWDVTVVIEMVVASRMTGRCTWWERWLPGSGGRLKVLNWNLQSFQLLEIIQVLDSISWVRCASGNVFFLSKNNGKPQIITSHNDKCASDVLMECFLESDEHYRPYCAAYSALSRCIYGIVHCPSLLFF